jgi:hypothetical protein
MQSLDSKISTYEVRTNQLNVNDFAVIGGAKMKNLGANRYGDASRPINFKNRGGTHRAIKNKSMITRPSSMNKRLYDLTKGASAKLDDYVAAET